MKDKYDIRPNNIIYKEMIAVYSTKPDRAKKVFDEYLQRIDHKEVKPETSTFRAYLDIFSSVGDIKGMKSVVKIMKEYGIEIDVNIVTDIMNGYLIGGNPQKALKTCNNYISKKGNSSKMGIVLGLKCQALNAMIHKLSDNELDKKHTLYADLENTIYHQFVEYGVGNMHYKNAQYLLESAISIYNDNPIRIAEIFESFVHQKWIKYRHDTDTNVVLLCSFSWISAKFVLKHIMTSKLNELLISHDKLIIVIGDKDEMKGLIINELLSYKPSIKCECDETDKTRLIVLKSALLRYLNDSKPNNSNCV